MSTSRYTIDEKPVSHNKNKRSWVIAGCAIAAIVVGGGLAAVLYDGCQFDGYKITNCSFQKK